MQGNDTDDSQTGKRSQEDPTLLPFSTKRSKITSTTSPFSHLPLDVVKEIFALLSLASLRNCRLANKQWRHIINHHFVDRILQISKTADIPNFGDFPATGLQICAGEVISDFPWDDWTQLRRLEIDIGVTMPHPPTLTMLTNLHAFKVDFLKDASILPSDLRLLHIRTRSLDADFGKFQKMTHLATSFRKGMILPPQVKVFSTSTINST